PRGLHRVPVARVGALAHRAPRRADRARVLRAVAAARRSLPPRAVRGDRLLIFATLGTHHQPFERFVRLAIATAAGRELVVQHGHTRPLAAGPSVRWHQWLAPDEVAILMRKAELVITH